jgi:hypothetical protein
MERQRQTHGRHNPGPRLRGLFRLVAPILMLSGPPAASAQTDQQAVIVRHQGRLRPDRPDDRADYGRPLTTREVLSGHGITAPAADRVANWRAQLRLPALGRPW